MALMTVQTILNSGVAPAFAAANASDTFADALDERTFLHVKNGGGASINVTVPAQATPVRVEGVGQVTVPDKVVAVPAGGERLIGPIPRAYVNATTGLVTANYSGVTSVTSGAFRVNPV